MPFQCTGRWFEHRRLDDDVALFWEPHVDPPTRRYTWHQRGAAWDLSIIAGVGLASLAWAVCQGFAKSAI